MSVETEIATMSTQLKGIKEDTGEIKNVLFGNGGRGLKVKVIILEVKFWILLVLVIPIWYCAVKAILNPNILAAIQVGEQAIK